MTYSLAGFGCQVYIIISTITGFSSSLVVYTNSNFKNRQREQKHTLLVSPWLVGRPRPNPILPIFVWTTTTTSSRHWPILDWIATIVVIPTIKPCPCHIVVVRRSWPIGFTDPPLHFSSQASASTFGHNVPRHSQRRSRTAPVTETYLCATRMAGRSIWPLIPHSGVVVQ